MWQHRELGAEPASPPHRSSACLAWLVFLERSVCPGPACPLPLPSEEPQGAPMGNQLLPRPSEATSQNEGLPQEECVAEEKLPKSFRQKY